MLNQRKLDHLQVCGDDAIDRQADSFARFKLRYNALPELSLEAVRTQTTFAGKTIAAPLIISGMTGGVGAEFTRINHNLALGAQTLNIPLGLGSMKVLLTHPQALESFKIRRAAPDAPLIANLGLVSFNHGLTYQDALNLVESLQPDVFGLHLNALQEVAQQGGDTDFRGILDHLKALRELIQLPIYVKECGGGIAPEQVRALADTGVDYIDISGNDGTSWAAVEARVNDDPAIGELFRDFGLPTAWILERMTPEDHGAARIVAGGGIRDGLQAVKALALGAHYVSVARPFFLAAQHSPEAVVDLGQRLIREIRTAMFLCGAGEIAHLNPDLFIAAHPPQQ